MLVVLGGFGSLQMPIDTVEMFDPKSQQWQVLPVSWFVNSNIFCSVLQ